MFDIKDYVVVITGGTGVLGRAIAKYLALNGAKVVILGRKEEVGREIVAGIEKEGGCCEFMKTDVMSLPTVQGNCDEIMAKYGRIDTLLNAAGGNMKGATIGPDQNFFDLEPTRFLRHPHLCSGDKEAGPAGFQQGIGLPAHDFRAQ